MEPTTLLCLLEEITQVKYDELWSRHNVYRQTVRDFWLGLGNAQRLAIVQAEQELLFAKLDELQMQDCDCHVCIATRIKLKAELSEFFQEYNDDLPSFSDQDKPKLDLCMMIRKEPCYLRVLFHIDRKCEVHHAKDPKEELEDKAKEVQKSCANRSDSAEAQTFRQEQFKQSVIVFTLLAARMLEKHIIHFYQEALALQRQKALIEEIEQEEKRKQEEKKRRDEHRKEILNKKRLLKQQEQERLLEEQKKKELEEQKMQEEKQRQALLKSQAKMELREKERLQKQEQRLKSLAKQKRKKEQKALELKKKKKEQGKQQQQKSSTPTPSTSTCSTGFSSPSSTASSVILKQDENEDEQVRKEDISTSYKSPVGCSPILSHSCIMPEADAHQWSLFSNSLMGQNMKEAEDKASEEKHRLLSNKSSLWSNGWDASTSVSENFHDCVCHHTPKKEPNSIVAIAKHVYTILDDISFTRYHQASTGYPLPRLHMMIHELLNEDSITIDDLHHAITSSTGSGFQCGMTTNNVLTVELIDLF